MARPLKQQSLDGMEVPGNAEIDEASAKLFDSRSRRLLVQKEELADEEALIAVMQRHGYKANQIYRHAGITSELAQADPKLKARVKIGSTDEVVAKDRRKRQDEPVGKGVMAKPAPVADPEQPGDHEPEPQVAAPAEPPGGRKLETGRAKMAKARKGVSAEAHPS